jgi:hypothetical protein
MPRQTATSIRVDPNVRRLRIYPVEGTAKKVADLQTVGLRLSREQAVHLARVLLALSQDHAFIDITGRRLEQRKSDGTFGITVTSMAK